MVERPFNPTPLMQLMQMKTDVSQEIIPLEDIITSRHQMLFGEGDVGAEGSTTIPPTSQPIPIIPIDTGEIPLWVQVKQTIARM